jgi:hypothetical protein
MTPERDKALVAKYPMIFQATTHKQEHMEMFGFECGDGWFDLIDKLCEELMIYSEQNPIHPVPVATQVKEKFGTLRFYVDQATNDQYLIISAAEHKSEEICERCGEPGTLDDSRSWIKTLCDKHRT